MSEPLCGPLLKIDRAKQHLSELNTKVSAFLARDPYVVIVEPDTDPAYHVQLFRVREEVPKDLAAIVGDVLHNLRAALDLTAVEMVRRNDPTVDLEKVHFPFTRGNAQDFEAEITKRHIHRTAPQVLAVFRSLKAYKTGNDALYAIHDMDLADKHRALVPVVHMAGIPNFSIIDREGRTFSTFTNIKMGPLKDGERITTFPASMKLKHQQDFKPSLFVAFGDDLFFEGEPLIPTLHDLTQLVDGIITIFGQL